MTKNTNFPIGPILLCILISFFLVLSACSQDTITAKVVEPAIEESDLADTLSLGLADPVKEEIIKEPETVREIRLEAPRPKVELEIQKIIKEKPKEKVQVVMIVKNDEDIEKISKLIEESSGDVTGEYKVGDVISAEITAEKLEEISKDESIEEIALEKEYFAFLNESIPQISIDTIAWASNYTGKGVKIAILDTGIDTTHEMLGNRVVLSKSFNAEGVNDLNGHGSHCAGIAAGDGRYKGAAPDASLLNAKVLTSRGSGTTSNIIAGINWALDPDDDENTDDGADIISMSFGGALTDLDGPLASTIRDAIDEGVIFVAAAGNCRQGCGGFFGVTMPGSMPEVITVGAVDENNNAASFSSGDTFTNYIKPDITAPGVNIMSATKNGGYKSSSGTSMSTPMVAGLIALMLEKESLSHNQIKAKLENTAIDLGSSGKDIAYGSGLVNVSAIFASEVVEVNETEESEDNETEEIISNITISTDSKIIAEDVEEFKFIISRNVSSNASNAHKTNLAIYARGVDRVYIKESLFDDINLFAQYLYLTVPAASSENITFVNGNHSYIQYDDKLIWHNGNTVYLVETLNISFDDPELISLLDTYSEKTTNNIGVNFEENIEKLQEIDEKILQQMHETIIQKINISDNEKNISFDAQWGAGSASDAKSKSKYHLTFGDSEGETFWTEGANNWYYIETDERGILEFGIDDIDSGDDLDLYLYDYQVRYADSSTRSSNKDEKITVTKNTDTTWAFYLKVIPYEITGSYAEGNIYSSKSCTVAWLSEYDCRWGNNFYQKRRKSDCDTEWVHIVDCDNYNDDGTWYCASDSQGKRVEVEYTCSESLGTCDSDTTTYTRDCDSDEKCSSGSCVDKICSDYSNNGGTCSWSDYYFDNTYCVGSTNGDPAECEPFGNTYCWDYLDSCTSDQYCKDPIGSSQGAQCFDYECSVDSVSWDKTSAVVDTNVGITVQGSHCDSSDHVTFGVYENDCWGVLEASAQGNETNMTAQGICNDAVNKQPVKADFSSNKATSTWKAEWQSDVNGDPEHYVYAYLQGDSDDDTRSGNKLTVSCKDNDNDGHKSNTCGGDDCNDNDAAKYPGNTEICDQKDNDCDNQVDEDGACDCHLSSVSWDKTSASMSSTAGFKVYGDSNCNGKYASMQVWEYDWSSADDPVQNNPSNPKFSNGVASGSWTAEWQYDAGTKPEYYLKATQGSSTVTSSNQLTVSCTDSDGDGYTSSVCGGSDCNDADSNIHPGHTESCNGIDDDCNNRIDETFNFQIDNNNCGACHIRCGDIGQYYQCQNYVCIRQRVCGDNICEGPETSANCAQDCYGDLKVVSINAPSEVDQNDYVTIKATVENKGTYTDQLNIEAGIVPDYWRGTIFSMEDNMSIQAVGFTTKCCQGNAYYDAKTISLGAGDSEEVTFNVYAPKTTSTDACGQASSGYYSAWDTSHEVMVGIYPACGQSYTHSITKNIKVKETPCNFDSDCGPGATCEYDSDNPSNSACIPNLCETQCSSDNLYFCEGSSLYMCKMNITNGCYQRTSVQTCPVGYECINGKSSCQKIVANTELSIEEASAGTIVQKQSGDIITVKLKHNKNENIQLEYDHDSFALDTSTCPSDSFHITKDQACKFTISDYALGQYTFTVKNGNKRTVNVIYRPDYLIITNKAKLLTRFSGDKTGVNDLLAKAYRHADGADRKAVIYDMDDYIGGHPWEQLSDYKETPRVQVMTDNSYSLDIGYFIRDKCEKCEGVVILGGDFVVPYYRRDVNILDWKLFYSDTRIDKIYSEIPYIKRTEKDFAELDDLFIFKGSYRGKKVKLLLPDSVSSDMSSQIAKFKDVINKSYKPKIEEIKSKDIYCKDQKLFEQYDSATLLIIGTEENNNAYKCLPFVAGYENRDTAFIDINPWDGREYSVIINTDDPHVLEALTKTIENGEYKKLKAKGWWYVELSLEAASYLMLLGEVVTGIPLDTVADGADSVNDCWVRKDGISCKISVVMMGIPWIPGKPFKKALKVVRKTAGKPIEEFLGKYGTEAIKFLAKIWKKGKLTQVGRLFKTAGDKWNNLYHILKSSIGEKIIHKWGDTAQDGAAKMVKVMDGSEAETLLKNNEEIAEAISTEIGRRSDDFSKIKIEKYYDVAGDGWLKVKSADISNFQYARNPISGQIKPNVGKVESGSDYYYFLPDKQLYEADSVDNLYKLPTPDDMKVSNRKQNTMYKLRRQMDKNEPFVKVPDTKISKDVKIGIENRYDSGLLVEDLGSGNLAGMFPRGTSREARIKIFRETADLNKRQKDALRKNIVNDFMFGIDDRNPGNVIAYGNKIAFIDHAEAFALYYDAGKNRFNRVFQESPTIQGMLNKNGLMGGISETNPWYADIVDQWADANAKKKKEILDLLKPEVDKMRNIDELRDQYKAASLYDDLTQAEYSDIMAVEDFVFDKKKGRIKKFVDSFDQTYAEILGEI